MAITFSAASLQAAEKDDSQLKINEANNKTLWYKKPAKNWMMEALPIGNGRIGAVFFGGIAKERIQFNEDSLWSGSNKPEAESARLPKAIEKSKKLLAKGKINEADQLLTKAGIPSRKHFGSYMTFGDLYLEFPHDEKKVSNYRRGLDLAAGLGKVTY